MIGIEWFMSIEQPWFSTLFGAFVVVSAFLAGDLHAGPDHLPLAAAAPTRPRS